MKIGKKMKIKRIEKKMKINKKLIMIIKIQKKMRKKKRIMKKIKKLIIKK